MLLFIVGVVSALIDTFQSKGASYYLCFVFLLFILFKEEGWNVKLKLKNVFFMFFLVFLTVFLCFFKGYDLVYFKILVFLVCLSFVVRFRNEKVLYFLIGVNVGALVYSIYVAVFIDVYYSKYSLSSLSFFICCIVFFKSKDFILYIIFCCLFLVSIALSYLAGYRGQFLILFLVLFVCFASFFFKNIKINGLISFLPFSYVVILYFYYKYFIVFSDSINASNLERAGFVVSVMNYIYEENAWLFPYESKSDLVSSVEAIKLVNGFSSVVNTDSPHNILLEFFTLYGVMFGLFVYSYIVNKVFMNSKVFGRYYIVPLVGFFYMFSTSPIILWTFFQCLALVAFISYESKKNENSLCY